MFFRYTWAAGLIVLAESTCPLRAFVSPFKSCTADPVQNRQVVLALLEEFELTRILPETQKNYENQAVMLTDDFEVQVSEAAAHWLTALSWCDAGGLLEKAMTRLTLGWYETLDASAAML